MNRVKTYSNEGTILGESANIWSISDPTLLRLTTSLPIIGSSSISSSHNEIFLASSELLASESIEGDSREESKSIFSNSAEK